MPTGAVNHKTQDLFEELENFNALFTFPDRTEKSLNHWKNLNLMQIRDKQCQTGPSGQSFVCDLDFADFQFLFPVFFVIVAHKVSYLVGMAILVITLVGFNKYYSTLHQDWGLLFFNNRSG